MLRHAHSCGGQSAQRASVSGSIPYGCKQKKCPGKFSVRGLLRLLVFLLLRVPAPEVPSGGTVASVGGTRCGNTGSGRLA